MKLNIVGDLHVRCLAGALVGMKGSRELDGISVAIQRLYAGFRIREEFWKLDGQRVRFTKRHMKLSLKELTGRKSFDSRDTDTIFAISSGLYHRGLIAEMLRIGALPWTHFKELSGVRRISTAETREVIYGYNKFFLGFLDALGSIGIRSFLIAPPPPRVDDRVGKIPPVNAHLILDPICRAEMRAVLDAREIFYVLPPDESWGPDGTLRRDWHDETDDHHANTIYGAAMLRKIVEAARFRFA